MFDLGKISGIYRITCTTTGKCYVGQSAQKGGIKRRWASHRAMLRHRKHYNLKFQRCWDKYGEESFTWEILEPLPRDKGLLTLREQFWIDTLKPELNLSALAGPASGCQHSEASRQKISQARKGMVFSDETRRRMSESAKARKASPETCKKISASNKGKPKGPMSEETRRRMSDALRGRVFSEEHRAKLAEAGRGRVFTAETRRKMAEKRKLQVVSAETLEKMRVYRTGRKASEETKAKMTKSQKERWARRKHGALPESGHAGSTPEPLDSSSFEDNRAAEADNQDQDQGKSNGR